jgi:tRNA (guanine37-N1)-methyltransferase
MKFHFLTIFPEMIEGYLGEAMLKRAAEKKLVAFDVKNIRDYSLDKHKKVDERPYGGGPGMVMTPEPILRAYSKLKMTASAKATARQGKIKVVMLSPSGKMFTNAMAAKMAKQYSDIVFICGRYEGVDDRVRKILKADEISVGDFVLTGGELPDSGRTGRPRLCGRKPHCQPTRLHSTGNPRISSINKDRKRQEIQSPTSPYFWRS